MECQTEASVPRKYQSIHYYPLLLVVIVQGRGQPTLVNGPIKPGGGFTVCPQRCVSFSLELVRLLSHCKRGIYVPFATFEEPEIK